MDDALKSQSPALVTLKAELGLDKARAFLVLIITDVVKFFNVGKGMTAEQIVSTADMIMKDFYFLKPEDFKLCFGHAKRGRYGINYDRMDGAIIFGWLDNYVNGRMNHAEQRSEEKHNEGRFIDQRHADRNRRDADDRDREFHQIQVDEFKKSVHSQPPNL